MSNLFYGAHFQQHHAQNPHPMAQPQHHHGRSRRAPRLTASQNSNRQFRGSKNLKDHSVVDPPSIAAFRARFEAGRSFDLDDDMEFCPNLLTFDERQSVTSGSSDRSSLSSGSPEASPTQLQIQPQHLGPALSSSSATASAFIPPPPNFVNNNMHLKIHQPSPYRRAIPIVDPSTGTRIASRQSSVSPGVMQTAATARAGGWRES